MVLKIYDNLPRTILSKLTRLEPLRNEMKSTEYKGINKMVVVKTPDIDSHVECQKYKQCCGK